MRTRETLGLVTALSGLTIAALGGPSAEAQRSAEAAWRAEGARDEGDPRAIVELLADFEAVAPGDTFRVGVRFELDPGWHVYWHNPGDAAMATDIELSADEASFSDIRWPAPERFEEAGFIVTYGYSREVVLLAEARAVPSASGEVTVTAVADFLVCKVECIPDRLTVRRTVAVRETSAPDAAGAELFDRFSARVPVSPQDAAIAIDVAVTEGRVEPSSSFRAALSLHCTRDAADCPELAAPPGGAAHAFFPDRIAGLTVRPAAVRSDPDSRGAVIEVTGETTPDFGRGTSATGEVALRGVAVLARAGGEPLRVRIDAPLPRARAAETPDTAGMPAAPPALPIWQAILLALLGGLILNLMPCVLPVLAIKAFGLASLAGEGLRARAAHAGAYTGGIVATFAALAGVVIALRAGGTELGWGFQLQEPLFVALLGAVLVVFALHLFGVFELSVRAGGLAARVDAASGLGRSFGEGALAVVVATPCTAPFLGTAVGFAFASEAPVIAAVFLAVGLGLAAPFVLLVLVPGARRIVPRPGPWMQRVKVVLGFALLATVVWLAWLIGRVAGGDGVVRLLGFLVAVSLATWIAGTWALRLEARRTTRALAAALALLVASGSGIVALRFDTDAPTETAVPAGYAAWSPDAVRASLADDRVVFVDFTADWCITCQVNETLVLGGGPVAAALASDGVAPLVADWTRRDERIRAELARHGRAGVPLYLVISPNDPDAPEVLPEVLTEAIVLDALRRAAPRGDDST